MRGGWQPRRRSTDSASGLVWSTTISSAGGSFSPPKAPTSPTTRRWPDLGFRLLQRHWRKGLASEGARELVRYGFDDVGLDRVIAQTMTVNTSSRAVLERIGLTHVWTFPTSMTAPVEGVDEGEVEYELTREQWERKPRTS